MTKSEAEERRQSVCDEERAAQRRKTPSSLMGDDSATVGNKNVKHSKTEHELEKAKADNSDLENDQTFREKIHDEEKGIEKNSEEQKDVDKENEDEHKEV
eukprot:12398805-Karenia_brevis.AAC.1